MSTESRTINRLSSLFPYILLLVAVLGLSFTIIIRRIDLTIFSLTLVIPLILSAVILLINKNINVAEIPEHANRICFSHLFLINSLIFIISLIILVSYSARPLTYFILISLYSGILLLQIINRRQNWTDSLILFQIILLSLNLIWGMTLKYPLYFGDTDTLGHLNLIDTILKTAHVATYNTYYQNYPLYHIFTAIGVEITNLSIRTALFVLMGIAWQVGIIFAFLIFKSITNSPRFALIACLLFASSSQLIFYGSYSIARSLAFVFFLCWIYLIFNKAQKDIRYLLLSLIIMAALITTHHLNVLYVIPVLLVVYICQIFVNRSQQERLINPSFIYLLTISCISYLIWVASSLADSNIPATIHGFLSSDMSLKGGFSLTHGYGFSVVMGTLFYSFVLLLCFLGMRVVIDCFKISHTTQMTGTFALAGFFMLLVYIPGLLYVLPLSDVILPERSALIVSPFVAFLMAYGLRYLYNMKATFLPYSVKTISLPMLSVGLVGITTFFSATSIGNANDTNYLPQTSTINSQYFTESELRSFSFMNNQGDNSLTLYGDYQTQRNNFSLSHFSTRNVIKSGDVSYISDGYLILRIAELQRKEALSFSPDGEGIVVDRYLISKLIPELDALANSSFGIRIYSDKDVQIYIVHNPSRS